MKIITDANDLESGKWYAVGMEDLDGNISWGCAPIYRHEGGGVWTDDDGVYIIDILDPTLQMKVGISQADAFMLQA